MLRYAITNGEYGQRAGSSKGALLTGYSSARQSAWITEAREAVLAQVRLLVFQDVEFFQIREKNLDAGDLAALTREVMTSVRGSKTRVLVNARADVAAATGAHGVHLGGTPGELTPSQVRQVYKAAGRETPLVSKACHTLAEVDEARTLCADLILFSPVFGKWTNGTEIVPGFGLTRLAQAVLSAGAIPVLALGGVTIENANVCVDAGAAGVAGIRLFQTQPPGRPLTPGVGSPTLKAK